MTTSPDIDARLAVIEQHLVEMLDRGASVPQWWLRVSQAASYSGLSEKSVRSLIASGKITPRRPLRGLIVVDRFELDSYINGSTSRPRTSRGNGVGSKRAREVRTQKTRR